MRKRKQYPAFVVYLSREEQEAWRDEAARQGLPMSVWVKEVVRARLNTKVRFREPDETEVWASDGQPAEETSAQTEEKQVD